MGTLSTNSLQRPAGPIPPRRGAFDYKAELRRFVGGYRYDKDEKGIARQTHHEAVELPHWKRAETQEAVNHILNDIAARGHMMQAEWGYARLPGEDRPRWAQFFFTSYMMSGLDGRGYVVAWEYKAPIIGSFAICDHKKVDDADARHERGWHPGQCSECGFDMSYDSGD